MFIYFSDGGKLWRSRSDNLVILVFMLLSVNTVLICSTNLSRLAAFVKRDYTDHVCLMFMFLFVKFSIMCFRVSLLIERSLFCRIISGVILSCSSSLSEMIREGEEDLDRALVFLMIFFV